MGAGGKKAKAKDKNSKAVAKQKIKKSKDPEAIEQQTTAEPSVPGSPDLVVQDQDPVSQFLEPVPEQPSGKLPVSVESSQSTPEETLSEETSGDAEPGVTQPLESDTDQPLAVKDNIAETALPASNNEDIGTQEPTIEVEDKFLPKEESESIAER